MRFYNSYFTIASDSGDHVIRCEIFLKIFMTIFIMIYEILYYLLWNILKKNQNFHFRFIKADIQNIQNFLKIHSVTFVIHVSSHYQIEKQTSCLKPFTHVTIRVLHVIISKCQNWYNHNTSLYWRSSVKFNEIKNVGNFFIHESILEIFIAITLTIISLFTYSKKFYS